MPDDPTTNDDLYQIMDELVTSIGELEDAISKAFGAGSSVRDVLRQQVVRDARPEPGRPAPGDDPSAPRQARGRPEQREDFVGPPLPPGMVQNATVDPVGGHGAEAVRVLLDIRDAVRLIVHQTIRERGGGGGRRDGGGSGGPGSAIRDALRPLTDRLLNNRLGRVGRQLLGGRKGGGVRTVRTSGGGGSVPKAEPVRGSVPRTPPGGAGSAAEGAAGGEAAGGAEAAGAVEAGAAGGPVGIAVGVIVAAGIALYEVAKAGKDLAYQQEEHARQLKEFSASIALSVAQLDTERTLRKLQMGENTAASAADLTRAIDKWERATAPWEQAGEKIKNTLGATVMEGLARILERFEPAIEKLNELLDAWLGEESNRDAGLMFGDWAQKIYDDNQRRRKEARDRMG